MEIQETQVIQGNTTTGMLGFLVFLVFLVLLLHRALAGFLSSVFLEPFAKRNQTQSSLTTRDGDMFFVLCNHH